MSPTPDIEEGDAAVEHDPHAEQNDLLTFVEARARITERMQPLQRRAKELEADIEATRDDAELQSELDKCHAELERLEQAFLRYSEELKE